MKRNKRAPLLQYWTTLYVITLCMGLVIIGVVSAVWMRHMTAQTRLKSLKVLAEEISVMAIGHEGSLAIQMLLVMLSALAILGWGIIYSLTRKLTEPIKNVTDAAKEIVKGNYDICLDKDVRELEIHELLQAFEDMVERLKQLESLRTELLAGVTHELKTPVTSISGLLQAVREEVVTGDEAKEFLEICSKETIRLQKMIEDLLEFNSFITGDIRVEKVFHNINDLVREISDQWLIGQEDERIKINIKLPEKCVFVSTDALRIRQILYNLFNNAKQAFVSGGMINLLLYEENGEVRIDIEDNGRGIPIAEQELIFERFFRGRDKKDEVRGMGIGLSFSKIIARSLGGELFLKRSTPRGSTFTLVLDRNTDENYAME